MIQYGLPRFRGIISAALAFAALTVQLSTASARPHHPPPRQNIVDHRGSAPKGMPPASQSGHTIMMRDHRTQMPPTVPKGGRPR